MTPLVENGPVADCVINYLGPAVANAVEPLQHGRRAVPAAGPAAKPERHNLSHKPSACNSVAQQVDHAITDRAVEITTPRTPNILVGCQRFCACRTYDDGISSIRNS